MFSNEERPKRQLAILGLSEAAALGDTLPGRCGRTLGRFPGWAGRRV